ncbi:hypothetical protein GCM10008023_32760 [Sphingomonas glacialis]|uniref:Uncharacterized protein n=1 Tax=Sphingomonas glacialis TaxID=658225 RepID=A0ABQ3LT58_9SPHN|nr:hypothetical protein [Sphingomonas glacialis]GHH22586.1 hypothetical protein GCM10008023_32760 [Sphingomonas glacialis]
MMLTGLLVFAIVVLKRFPETAAARWMMRMVGATLTALGRVERKHVIFLALMTVVLVAGTELLALAGPFDIALVLLWDISAYVDIVLTTMVVATATRGMTGWHALVARIASRRSPRARRQRSVRKAAPSANDDERPAAFARAA